MQNYSIAFPADVEKKFDIYNCDLQNFECLRCIGHSVYPVGRVADASQFSANSLCMLQSRLLILWECPEHIAGNITRILGRRWRNNYYDLRGSTFVDITELLNFHQLRPASKIWLNEYMLAKYKIRTSTTERQHESGAA